MGDKLFPFSASHREAFRRRAGEAVQSGTGFGPKTFCCGFSAGIGEPKRPCMSANGLVMLPRTADQRNWENIGPESGHSPSQMPGRCSVELVNTCWVASR